MENTEFYTTPSGDVMIESEDGPAKLLKEDDDAFIHIMLDSIMNFYPCAYNALMACYKTVDDMKYRNFLAVRRFIKCNFGVYDNRSDIDEHKNFNFEFVNCPLRGECKFDQIICSPVFDTSLSNRELEVMKMLYDGMKDDEVSDKLFISLNTVNNHRKYSFKKLGVHSIGEFIRYAQKNRIFNK